MTEEQQFSTDIIRILPLASVIRVQAPSLDDAEFLSLFEQTGSFYREAVLTKDNKDSILRLIQREQVVDNFQLVQVIINGNLAFEGHDGMEIGSFSKEMEIPEELKLKYQDMLVISTVW